MIFLKDKQFQLLLMLVIITLLVGVVFYHFHEKLTWIDSLYLSTTTLTTIGYGDLLPTTNISKIFTIFYALLGIGIIFSFINFWATKRIEDVREELNRLRVQIHKIPLTKIK
jgi:voltage-gated potassium channel Kch